MRNLKTFESFGDDEFDQESELINQDLEGNGPSVSWDEDSFEEDEVMDPTSWDVSPHADVDHPGDNTHIDSFGDFNPDDEFETGEEFDGGEEFAGEFPGLEDEEYAGDVEEVNGDEFAEGEPDEEFDIDGDFDDDESDMGLEGGEHVISFDEFDEDLPE